MTVSESEVSLDDHHSWKTSQEFEQTSKESHSSTGSSSKSFAANLALDTTSPKLPAMNLVLKTRIASRQYNDACDLRQTDTKSTMRTTSFTTKSTSEFGVKTNIAEELTVTDDGPVEQVDLKEEEVYQKLSELKIVPVQDAVPEFVRTPPPPPSEKTTTRSTTTPSTSACTSPSHATHESSAVTVEKTFFPQEDDSSDSDLSDISGLTGTFQSGVDASSVAVVPPELSGSTASPQLLVDTVPYPEEVVKTRLLQQAAAATTSARRLPHYSTAPTLALKKSVSFSTVSIREYQRILGDNPSCSCGPSISIGWEFDTEDCFSINQWEDWRREERDATLLVLCREEREELLLQLGYNHNVIAQAIREIVKVKNKRRQTIHNLEAMAVEEMMESASKKLKSVRKRGLFGKRKKKKKEEHDDDDDDESVYA